MLPKKRKSPILPSEIALQLVGEAAKAAGISKRETEVLDLLVKSCKQLTVDGASYFPTDEVRNFISNFNRAVASQDSSFLQQKRGYRVNKIADIEEFTESPEYMNQGGYIRPVIKYELDRLFTGNDFVEAVLTGAIGIGKNYFADMALAYMIYLLSCYYNPQMEHDLAPGSSIIFIQQSKSLKLAKKVVFDQFAERLKLSPYFAKNFPFDPNVKSELRFPKNIFVLPVGGSDTGAIGMNVYGGVIDELNFMERTTDSMHTRYTGEEEYDQAERLYRALIRRMKSRFMQKGRLPGKLLLVSSVNYPGDFTDRKIEEAEKDKQIFVMKYSQWEALPSDRFCGETFPVEVGNEVKRSRILESVEQAVDVDDIIHVPIEYKTEFERDLEASLRDLAGVATGTKHPFIPQRELIQKAQDAHVQSHGNTQLFRMDTVALSNFVDSDHPHWDEIIDMAYLEEHIVDNSAAFALHIDVGLTNDAAGVAIGRIIGYKIMPAAKIFNERTEDFIEVTDIRAPMYQIDGVMQVVAPPQGEVDLELLGQLGIWLRGRLNLKWGTLDSYQSAQIIQQFRKARIRAGVLSVDTSLAPYAELKQAIKDERLWLPNHSITARELRNIEKDAKKNKIDHPTGGSKDCADAAAGVVYMLQRREASYGRAGTARRGRGRTAPDAGKRPAVRHVRIGKNSRRRRRS